MDLNHITITRLKPLDKISPSRFIELEECLLRVALAASNIPRLLPPGPAARLGTIIHSMFDLASKSVINNEEDFNEKWNENLKKTEDAMSLNDLEKHFLPLEQHTRNFDVKKNLCRLGVGRIIDSKSRNTGSQNYPKHSRQSPVSIGSELYFETPDHKVRGIIDEVRYGTGGVEIIDYKSGIIVEETIDGLAVKKSYQIQLKIYAALYYLNKEIWPSKLKLLGINQQDFDVSFTPEECLQLIKSAKSKLEEVNKAIISGFPWENMAAPSPKACQFCSYRPVCKKYMEFDRDGDKWPFDIAGRVLEKRELKNGYRIVVETARGNFIIRALDPERHNILNGLVENIMLFNLKPDGSPERFIAGDFTVSYMTPTSFS